mmetsp:Transcript_71765/g.167994  ORF Transcript_71765/g.167994 Transcript_71765/m.167994 type:complete len:527 (+) Transcript_71765:68-1648(+)
MAERRVTIIFEGSEGASRFYQNMGLVLQNHGFRVSLVGPVNYQTRSRNLGLAYVSIAGLDYKELLVQKPAVSAMTAGCMADLIHFLDAEATKNEENSLPPLCEAVKGFDPGMILSSSRPLHLSVALGNALCIPVLHLTSQAPVIKRMPRSGDFLDEPAWKTLRERGIASFLRQAEQKAAPIMAKCLGAVAPFWPTARQILALAGPGPLFPVLLSRTLVSCFDAMRKFDPLLYADKPKYAKLPPNVFEVQAFSFTPEIEDSLQENSKEEIEMLDHMCETSAGERPIFISFGFFTCHSSAFMTQLCVRALREKQLRAIIDSGLAGLSAADLSSINDPAEKAELEDYCQRNVLFVRRPALHRILSRVKLVVHEGGSFMTKLCLLYNKPTIVLPVMGESEDNAALVGKMKIGLMPSRLRTTTPDKLANLLFRVYFEQDAGERYVGILGAPFTVKPKFVNYALMSWMTPTALLSHSHRENFEADFADMISNYWEKSVSTSRHLQRMEDLRESSSCRRCCCPGPAKRVQEEP